VMLCSMKELGIFFKYSPKKTRRLEQAVNIDRSEDDKINKSMFKLFCETRWTEKHESLQDFDDMYVPLLLCLQAISDETELDSKAKTESNGLLKRLTDSTFIACFQTVLYLFGHVKALGSKLQGSTLDVVTAYEMVEHVRYILANERVHDDTAFDNVYKKMLVMAKIASLYPQLSVL